MQKIFAIYKPKGPTSREILNEIQKITGIRKVGHAGTLDPLAKGVLVVGIGREATKQLAEVVKKEKEYLAKVRLGMTSTTDDEEGRKNAECRMQNAECLNAEFRIQNAECLNSECKMQNVEMADIKRVVEKFKGQIMQIPPVYSAVKVKGKEAYKLARRGEMLRLKPRKVEIKNIKVLKYKWPYLELKVVTGPGVYIRALARDIGKELGVGGYLAELERTRVGEFSREHAMFVSQFKDRL